MKVRLILVMLSSLSTVTHAKVAQIPVVVGEDTKPVPEQQVKDHPHIVSGGNGCTSTIVGRRIYTAAHCIVDGKAEVAFDGTDQNRVEVKFHNHPSWENFHKDPEKGEAFPGSGDPGKSPVDFSISDEIPEDKMPKNLTPLCLSNEPIAKDTKLRIVGMGGREERPPKPWMVSTKVLDQKNHELYTEENIESGDSGGAFFLETNPNALACITSGTSDGRGVCTPIEKVWDFITEKKAEGSACKGSSGSPAKPKKESKEKKDDFEDGDEAPPRQDETSLRMHSKSRVKTSTHY